MDRNTKKTDLQRALKNCRGSFAMVGFFSLFINLLMLVPSIYMLQIYDRVISSGSEVTLVMLTLLMVALMLVMGGLEWMRSLILVRVSNRIEVNLNQRLYNAVFRMSLYTGGQGSSTQALSDLTSLRQFLTSNGLFAFFDAPWIPIYMLVMFIFHPVLGWIAVAGGVALVVIAIINDKATQNPLKEANKFQMAAAGMTSASIRNAEVIESMGMLDNVRGLWLRENLQSLAYQSSASQRAGFLINFSKTFRMLLQSLILGAGAYLAINQELTPGLMIAGSILLGRALAPIDLMIGSWKGFVSARQQYARLNTLLSQIPTTEEKMALPDPTGDLLLEGVVVSSPGSRTPIIKGIQLKIDAGDSVAIVGPSGAGKSTLARAILGIWPCLNGKVRLDGADIFSWDRAHLGPHIGYLPQDIELFDGTISQNISRFGELDSEAVVKAAKSAGVHDMILALPKGYDSVIGATGGILSGGQRQRVGLARALYGEPVLVVLDEPNSNLDQHGEIALSRALEEMSQKGTTVITITHRPSVLAQVDKLLVIKDGRAEMYGPRKDVLPKLIAAQAAVQPQTVVPVPRPAAPKPVLPVYLQGAKS
jgi:ATP-binding cassette subfamily C protein EexD